jgi:hypothetical protein
MVVTIVREDRLTPARCLVRYSVALTIAAGVMVALLFVLPMSWTRGFDWYLFLAFSAFSGIAIALAFFSTIVRRANEVVGIAVALLGINLFAVLGVVVALFNFRMGAP